jgi:phosphatidylserine/phosphatidylglycerophosphate/cardiolipin synthase-like enzyme
MKFILFSWFLVAWISIAATAFAQTEEPKKAADAPPVIEVYFNPRGGLAEAIIREIDAAKTSVLVQAYSFDYLPIAESLAAAKKRKVEVLVLLDKDKTLEEKPTVPRFLEHAGVSLKLDGSHHTAHNKTMIIDNQTVITGSFNFTKHSEKDNAENLLVIHDHALAEKYTANWKAHDEHSKPYQADASEKPSK